MDSLLYFLWISLTITACLSLSLRRAHKRKFPLELFFSVTGWMLISIPLGARLLHIAYEEPHYYAEAPLRVFELWRGGFVYYGGLVFSVLILAFYFRKRREKTFWQTSDFFAPILALGTGLGRWACFFQGCCYGKEADIFWAYHGRHPTQIYMFAWEFLLFGFLVYLEKRRFRLFDGSLFLTWIFLSSLGRFIIEFYRDDFRGHLIMGLSISQMISLGLVIMAVASSALLKRKSST